jgi:hypothetical protein
MTVEKEQGNLQLASIWLATIDVVPYLVASAEKRHFM